MHDIEMTVYDCIIIGSGPAGLSLASRLDKLDIQYLLIDKEQLAETWRTIPEHTTLISQWWTNVLDLQGLFKHPPWKEATAGNYYEHLVDFASRKNIKIKQSCAVHGLQQNSEGNIALNTSKGQLVGKTVVCATGYFSNPTGPIPDFDNDKSISTVHTSRFNINDEPSGVGKSALVVGKRVSAGQAIIQLHDKKYQVSLSTKGTVQHRRHGVYGKLRETIYFLYEPFWLKYFAKQRSNSFPVMDGGKAEKLIVSGVISVRPTINAIRDGLVHFEDGSTDTFDKIILATGYKPAIDFAKGFATHTTPYNPIELQHREYNNLFFIGYDNLINFRSRYLRGIRSDASLIANCIKRYLQEQRPSSNTD